MLHVTEVSVESDEGWKEEIVLNYITKLKGELAFLKMKIAEHKCSFPEDKGDATEEDKRLWEVLDEH